MDLGHATQQPNNHYNYHHMWFWLFTHAKQKNIDRIYIKKSSRYDTMAKNLTYSLLKLYYLKKSNKRGKNVENEQKNEISENETAANKSYWILARFFFSFFFISKR